MSARRSILAGLVLCGAAVLGGCEGPEGAPDKPTWVDDVQPILRANCFHCHGSSADFPRLGTRRWDFLYDPADTQLQPLGDFSAVFGGMAGVSPKEMPQIFQITAFVADPADMRRMPPPPATRLSDRDIQVLRNWMATGRERGTRNPNAKPAAAWLDTGKVFVVTDADREQVLGKVSCGGREALLIRSGTHSVPQGAGPPCTVTLYDGQDTSVVTLN